MTGSAPVQKSLVEQILDEMFAALETQAAFDANTVASLKQLVSEGNLAKDAKVISALRPSPKSVEEASQQ